MKSKLITLLLLFCSFLTFAQTTIKGTVYDENNETLPGATVRLKNAEIGTVTDNLGKFTLTVSGRDQKTLVVSYIGFRSQEVVAVSNEIEVRLTQQVLSSDEVVISASRVEEELVKAAVTVEKISSRQLQQSSAATPYDALGNMKGVDILTQSLSFKSVNMRGFGANNNNRFVQHTDGMDNRSPGLGFGFGSVAGIADLDIQSIEIVPGASSALYGPDALQGLMLTKSKNPFNTPGLSAQVKAGFNNVGSASFSNPTPYTDIAVRYAHVINDKFAIKASVQRLDGTDFVANDYNDRSTRARTGFWKTDAAKGNVATEVGYVPNNNTNTNTQYDGVNIYGDDINGGGAFTYPATFTNPALQSKTVTRKGYTELEMLNNNGKVTNTRANVSMHYKITKTIEAQVGWYYGQGNLIRTAGFREYFPDYKRNQFRAEISSDKFFVRGYMTSQNAEGFNLGQTAAGINNAFKPIGKWKDDFATNYATTNNVDAARAFADNGRYVPGSAEFNRVRDLFSNTWNTDTIAAPGFKGLKGNRFRDNSKMYHGEGMYNLSSLVGFADLLVGASVRQYQLESGGTSFPFVKNADGTFKKQSDGSNTEYTILEYGTYALLTKEIKIVDKLSIKPTIAVRYDKNEYFKGGFTPRASAVLNYGSHNLRASWQSAFRNPSPSQLLNIPPAGKGGEVGGSKVSAEAAGMFTNPVYLENDVKDFVAGKITEADLKGKAYDPNKFTTEKIKTWELGYKTLIGNKLFVDAFYFQSQYSDFIAAQNHYQPNTVGSIADLKSGAFRSLQVNFNNSNQIFVNGYGIGLEYAIGKGYTISGNFANQVGTITLKDSQGNIRKDNAGNEIVKRKMSNPEVSQLGRNFFISPENRFNISIANPKVTKNIGFNVTYRWTDKMWVEQGTTAGDIMLPSWSSLDAQVSYLLPKMHTNIRLGATNLLNKYYSQGYGLAQIGGLYYVGITYDGLSYK